MRERLSLERELAELGTRDSGAVIQPGQFSSGQNTADEHDLLYEFKVDQFTIPEQTVIVKDWISSLNITRIKVGAAAIPDNKMIKGVDKINPLPFGQPKRMWIQAGERGQISMFLEFEYRGTQKMYRSSKVAQAHFRNRNVRLDLSCTAEGGIRLTPRPPLPRRPSNVFDLGIDIQVYQRRDKPKNRGMRGIPASVWDEWMKKLCILRIAMIVNLTVTNGPGWLTVEVKDASSTIPDTISAGSTGPSTAVLGPMIVDLVPTGARPPITAKQGLIQDVYFGRNSFEIDKVVEEEPNRRIHQGTKLDAWIRDDLIGRWDVREALYRGDLPIRGEARASATFKGKNSQELLRYNQALSEKRREAVVSRLKGTLSRLNRDIKLDATQLRIGAIGASKAPAFGEENVFERRCRLQIDAADLEAAIKKLYKETNGWWWDR